eukprot:2783660-Rhodomonas_salina.1
MSSTKYISIQPQWVTCHPFVINDVIDLVTPDDLAASRPLPPQHFQSLPATLPHLDPPADSSHISACPILYQSQQANSIM